MSKENLRREKENFIFYKIIIFLRKSFPSILILCLSPFQLADNVVATIDNYLGADESAIMEAQEAYNSSNL